MRCSACTQRNSVAARSCQFCGQKFKKKPLAISLKLGAGIVGVVAIVGVAAAVVPSLNKPDTNLTEVANRMAAGPKTAEDAQNMKVELDGALMKFLEKNGTLSSSDMLTKLQSQLNSSTFEVLVFDLPKGIKLVEVDCVLQPSDYLVIQSSSGPKVARMSGLSVFDDSRLVPTTPDPCLILLGHTTGEGPREPQIKAVSLMPTGEVSDKSDKIVPVIKGNGTAAFVGTTSDIKLERMLVSSAKHQGLFVGNIPFRDESFVTTLAWNKGHYDIKGSLGNSEFAPLYAVASGLVDSSEANDYKQYLSEDVRNTLKGLDSKPVAAPGGFKLIKQAASEGSSRRKKRSTSEGSSTYTLVSKDRAFSVTLNKVGRWTATNVKETSPPSQSEMDAVAQKPPEEPVVEAPKVVEKAPEVEKVASTEGVSNAKEELRKAKEEAKQAEREAASLREESEKLLKEQAKKKEEKVAKKKEKESEPEAAPSGGKTNAVVARSVSLRTGPGRGSRTITNIPRGTSLRVLAEQDSWLKVSVDGKSGYVYKSYISMSKAGKVDRDRDRDRDREPKVAKEKEKSEPKKTASKPEKSKSERTTASSVKSSKYKSQLSSGKPSHAHKETPELPGDEPVFVP